MWAPCMSITWMRSACDCRKEHKKRVSVIDVQVPCVRDDAWSVNPKNIEIVPEDASDLWQGLGKTHAADDGASSAAHVI